MGPASYTVRLIEPGDNAAVEQIIRGCLIEFNAAREGTAWTDPMLGRFSEVYSDDRSRYWVAVDGNGQAVGGCGIGPLSDELCELQKMYLLPSARGTGLAEHLLNTALGFAREHYRYCCLETLENMKAAQRFYEKMGFTRVRTLPVITEHFACDVRYIKKL